MRSFVFAFNLTICLVSTSFGQNRFVDLTSPHNTVKTHLGNLLPNSYHDSLSAEAFNLKTRSVKEAISSAVKLKRVLDGNGIIIYLDELPTSKDYYDSASNKNKFVLVSQYPNIFLLKNEDGNWYYSDSSIDAIDNIYNKTFRFGTGQLIEVLYQFGNKKVLGIYLFQYILILILTMSSGLVYWFLSFFTNQLLTFLFKKVKYNRVKIMKYVRSVTRPLTVLIIILVLIIFTPSLQLSPLYSKYLLLILKVAIPLFGTIIAYRLVDILSVYLAIQALKTESTLDDQLVPLFRKTLKLIVIFTGTLFILHSLNVNIVPLLTGLSIGGLAFALAAQDTIKNFFGSMMIFIDRPFQVGDWITAPDLEGEVEEVGIRSSRIRTFKNSLTSVPNGQLANCAIDNLGKRMYRRFLTTIAITYDTPPALIETFVQGLRQIVVNHPDTVKDKYQVYLNEMGASSINILFCLFFEVPTWPDELKARHEILIQIMELAKSLGVRFAFPTQTLHIENLPGQASLSPIYMSNEEANDRLKKYFKT